MYKFFVPFDNDACLYSHMDHNSRRDTHEKCQRRRPDDLIQTYERIREVVAEYDYLPAEILVEFILNIN